MRYIFRDTKKLNSFFSLKDIFLIILTCLIDLFVEFFYIYLDDRLSYLYEGKDEGKENYNDELYFVQFIFLSFFSYFFLDQKFYKHHYISLACIIIFEIIRFIVVGYGRKFPIFYWKSFVFWENLIIWYFSNL